MLNISLAKWGIILAAFLAYTISVGSCAYRAGTAKEEKQQTRTLIKEVKVRIPVVQEREVESLQARDEIQRLRKELRDATEARPENPSCDLSDAEFNSFRQLSAKTRRTE